MRYTLKGAGAGDEVEVTLELDDAPRTVETPDVLAQAFTAEPAAAEAWEKLSYSKQHRDDTASGAPARTPLG